MCFLSLFNTFGHYGVGTHCHFLLILSKHVYTTVSSACYWILETARRLVVEKCTNSAFARFVRFGVTQKPVCANAGILLKSALKMKVVSAVFEEEKHLHTCLILTLQLWHSLLGTEFLQ